ncbi:MAG: hypothetical protein LBU90_00665 [Bacteroidales bacterium]|nr:hypothetical protein [Bacteroidales bacterium]
MKNTMRTCVITIAVLGNICHAQNFSDVFLNLQVTSGVEFTEDEIAHLQELYANPLNLNEIREEDCAEFVFLNEFEQRSLWDFLAHNRPLQSIYEVQFALAFSVEKAKLLAQFCYVSTYKPPLQLHELLQKGHHTLAFSYFLPQVNFSEYRDFWHYEGNPTREIVRYRFNSFNRLAAGVTLKNDAGERFYTRERTLFDYKSAYAQYKTERVEYFVGDYEVQAGQGLVVSQGGFFGKSIDRSTQSNLLQAKVHSSANEFDFFRGALLRFSLPKCEITPFVSLRSIDGKAKADTAFSFQLYETGYHRTATEIANRGAITLQSYGLHASSAVGAFSCALMSLLHHFSLGSVQSTMLNSSVSLRYAKPKIIAFGEIAFDKQWHYAACAGLQAKLHQDFVYSCVLRSFGSEYESFMTHSLSEQSAVQNETGVYQSFDAQLTRALLFTVAHDVFYMPAERYFVKNATRGSDSWARLQYSTWSGVRAYMSFRNERKTDYTSGEQTRGTIEKVRNYVTLYAKLPFGEQVYIASSWHQAFIRKQERVRGFVCYQDFVYKPLGNLKLYARYAQFNADYEARLSAWEENVQYAYSSQSYFYEGSQVAAVVEWNVKKRLYVEAKISKFFYRHPETLPKQYALYPHSNPQNYTLFAAYKF